MRKYKTHQQFKRGNLWLNNTEFLVFKEKIKWKLRKKKKKLHRSRNIWFNLKLYAKKFLKSYYPNMTEMQFKKYIGESNIQYLKNIKLRKNYIQLYHILERRLDIALVRTNLVKTPNAARQLINHKNVFVDNVLVTTPGYLLSNGQVICIKRISTQYLKIKTNIKTNKYIFKTFKSILKKKLFSPNYKNFVLNTPVYKVRLPSYIKAVNLTNLNYKYYIFLFNTPRWVEIPYPTKMWVPSICQRKPIKNSFIDNKIKLNKQKFKLNQFFKLKIKKRKKVYIFKTKLNNLKLKIKTPSIVTKKKLNISQFNPLDKKELNMHLYKKNYIDSSPLTLNTSFKNDKSRIIKKKNFYKFLDSFNPLQTTQISLLSDNTKLNKTSFTESVKKNQKIKLLFKKKTKIKSKKKRKLKLNKKLKKEKIRVFSKNFFNSLIWFYKRSQKKRLSFKK
uniref:Ribosomal protein S4 n=1 Tax=Cyanophora biloba TaxID=1489483 RepID=A0A873WRJ4_9EUKA|nr:ribosomal protein S4 [Cyanophora biloba]QPB15005.1 ribosomal protein S4 [Cyanophora biloba]